LELSCVVYHSVHFVSIVCLSFSIVFHFVFLTLLFFHCNSRWNWAVSINVRLNWNINSQFDWRLQSPSIKLGDNLSNCAVYIYTRIASHKDNYKLRVLESANQTISISAQAMEQQQNIVYPQALWNYTY
jgi:hypothetical protein